MAECVPTPDIVIKDPPPLESYNQIECEDMLEKLRAQSRYVKLNVGGALFTTTVGTLTKHDNMLRAMFSGRMELQTDEEG